MAKGTAFVADREDEVNLALPTSAMRFLTINWRLSIYASVGAVALIALISGFEFWLQRGDLVAGITAQQLSTVHHIAEEVDAKLDERLQLLAASAKDLRSEDYETAAAFEARYARQPAMSVLFENVALVALNGIPFASYPARTKANPTSLADRKYFQDVLRTRHSVISEPVRSRLTGEPVVVLATPVFDASDRVVGVLLGLLPLTRPNLLGALAREKVGTTGYYFVVTRGSAPMYVVHPDPKRIMQSRPANGAASTTKAIDGFEGTQEDINSNGLHALFSYATMKSTGWVLAAVLPADEAFAPLYNTERRVGIVALLAALMVAPLAWFIAWRLLSPLTNLSESVRRTDITSENWTDVRVERGDEVGQLAGSFNSLMRRLRSSQADLKASEQWIRSITDNLPALVCYVDPDHRFQFNNRAYARWLDKPLSEITGKKVVDVYGEEVYERLAPSLNAALAGKQTKFEVAFTGRDGTQRFARGRYVPHVDKDGRLIGVFGLISDDTRIKQAEIALSTSEKRLLDITNNIPAVIGQFDMAERCLFANNVGLKVHGLKRDQLPTLTFGSHIPPALYEQHAEALRTVLSGKRSEVHGQRVLDGRDVWFKAHLIPDYDHEGRQRGFFVVTFDVTTMKQAEIARAQSEQRVRNILDNLPVLISQVDADQRFIYGNSMFTAAVGAGRGDDAGRPVAEILGPDLYRQREPMIRRCLAGERVESNLTSVVNGTARHFQSTYFPDIWNNCVVGMIALSTDVTALKNAERRLEVLAHVDSLTGLPNRLRFDEELNAAIEHSEASEKKLGLMFLDVDHFKDINDTYGHAAGDAVLREFAFRLRRTVRPTDLCARLAGDEFVAMLEDAVAHKAHELAAKIVACIGEPFRVEGVTINVTTSVGVAFRTDDVETSGALLAKADRALYQAKVAGRNTFRLAA